MWIIEIVTTDSILAFPSLILHTSLKDSDTYVAQFE